MVSDFIQPFVCSNNLALVLHNMAFAQISVVGEAVMSIYVSWSSGPSMCLVFKQKVFQYDALNQPYSQ
jgi:hypothetical protein